MTAMEQLEQMVREYTRLVDMHADAIAEYYLGKLDAFTQALEDLRSIQDSKEDRHV